MSHLETRQYSGANDIAALVEFTGAVLSARLPRHSYWYPGDIVWMLFTHADMGLFDPIRDIQLWLDQAGRVVVREPSTRTGAAR